jgi:hypothetical protein
MAREGAQPMATQFISRQNVLTILGAVMIVSLALTIITFPVALIWIGQPPGNVAIKMADAFATVFSVAFFAAFALAMSSSGPAVADHIAVVSN